MDALLALFHNETLVFLLVLSRLGGVFTTAPILGLPAIPVRTRAFLAIGAALLVAPLYWHTPVSSPQTLAGTGLLIGAELVVGLTLGLGVSILFAGLQVAGQIMGQMSGMHLANVFDPNVDDESPIFAQFLRLTALAVYVLVNGPGLCLDALIQTFRWMPPGKAAITEAAAHLMVEILAESFRLGVQVAAPCMVALLMSILVLGLISRTLPQLNVMMVGFSLNGMVMLGVLSLSLAGVCWTFEQSVAPTLDALRELWIPPEQLAAYG